jgi:hypothetical protein
VISKAQLYCKHHEASQTHTNKVPFLRLNSSNHIHGCKMVLGRNKNHSTGL